MPYVTSEVRSLIKTRDYLKIKAVKTPGGKLVDFHDGGDHVHIWGLKFRKDEHIWGLRN